MELYPERFVGTPYPERLAKAECSNCDEGTAWFGCKGKRWICEPTAIARYCGRLMGGKYKDKPMCQQCLMKPSNYFAWYRNKAAEMQQKIIDEEKPCDECRAYYKGEQVLLSASRENNGVVEKHLLPAGFMGGAPGAASAAASEPPCGSIEPPQLPRAIGLLDGDFVERDAKDAEREDAIRRLQTRCVELDAKVAEQDAKIAEQDATIRRLQTQFGNQVQQGLGAVADLAAAVAQLDTRFAELERRKS